MKSMRNFNYSVRLIYFVLRSRFDRKLLQTTADYIQSRISLPPKLLIICGSGLGEFGDSGRHIQASLFCPQSLHYLT